MAPILELGTCKSVASGLEKKIRTDDPEATVPYMYVFKKSFNLRRTKTCARFGLINFILILFPNTFCTIIRFQKFPWAFYYRYRHLPLIFF